MGYSYTKKAPKRVLIIGAGGHGREVADIFHHRKVYEGGSEVLGFIDDNRTLKGATFDEIPVLGDWSWFDENDCSTIGVICAIGTPAVCKRLVARATRLHLDFVNAISPLAHISPFATLGEGISIFPGVVLNTGSRVGDHTILNLASTVSHDSEIGSFCNINPGAHIAGNVTIGEGCYVGMGANIIQGRTVGSETVVGAGAVVIRDLPSRVVAVGVPANVRTTVQPETQTA